MRKTFTLVAFACLAIGLQAQFIRTDMGFIGDNQRYRKADTTGVVQGPAGAGQSWDFSTLVATPSAGTNAYIATSDHPQGGNFPNADLVLTLANSQFAFYKSSADSLSMVGEKSPSNTTITYTDYGTWFRYPQTLGIPNLDSVYGSYPDGFISTVSRKGLIQTTFDADGSLITPYATFPTTKRVEYIAIHHDSSWTGAAEVDVWIKRYEWYESTNRMPVLIINRQIVILNGGNPTIANEVWWADDNAVEVAPAAAGEFAIYPNPTQGTSHLRYRLDASDEVLVEVVNVLGARVQKIYEGTQTAAEYSFDLGQGLPKGVYMVHLRTSKGSSSQRMILN